MILITFSQKSLSLLVKNSADKLFIVGKVRYSTPVLVIGLWIKMSVFLLYVYIHTQVQIFILLFTRVTIKNLVSGPSDMSFN